MAQKGERILYRSACTFNPPMQRATNVQYIGAVPEASNLISVECFLINQVVQLYCTTVVSYSNTHIPIYELFCAHADL